MAVYGDTAGILRDHEHAGDQIIALADNVGGTAYGDAQQLPDQSSGGDDVLTGAWYVNSILFGDADTMHAAATTR